MRTIKSVRTRWSEVVLVCRKCSRKLDGGFGRDGDEKFAKALRRSLKEAGTIRAEAQRVDVGVVEVDCLDICPKGAVVAMRAAAPERWVVIPKGTSPTEVAAALGVPLGGR